MSFAENSRTAVRIWSLIALVFTLAVTFRWLNLGVIAESIFDEAHYVPAAEVLVGIKEHPGMGAWSYHPLIGKAPAPNFEHPLLGKFAIGLGLRMFDELYFGARFFPALIGSLGLILMGCLAWQFFGRLVFVLLALLFLGFDSLHMLHSRLAMLDIFLVTALLGLLLSSWHLLQNLQSKIWRLSAALWIAAGLSCKWVFALAILGFCWSILFLAPASWRQRVGTLFVVGLIALGLYHLWFFYYAAHGFSYGEWLEFHIAANAATTGKLAQHPYNASAFSMLFNSRNIWYYFKQLPEGMMLGLVGLLNPVLIFSLLPALASIFFHYRKRRQREDAFILGWFACCYLPFHVLLIERQGFLYYMLLLLPLIILAVLRMLEIFSRKIKFEALALGYSTLFLAAAGFFIPVVLAWPMTQDFYLWLIKFTGV